MIPFVGGFAVFIFLFCVAFVLAKQHKIGTKDNHLYCIYSILNKCLWQVKDVHPVFQRRFSISCWGCPSQDAIVAKV